MVKGLTRYFEKLEFFDMFLGFVDGVDTMGQRAVMSWSLPIGFSLWSQRWLVQSHRLFPRFECLNQEVGEKASCVASYVAPASDDAKRDGEHGKCKARKCGEGDDVGTAVGYEGNRRNKRDDPAQRRNDKNQRQEE